MGKLLKARYALPVAFAASVVLFDRNYVKNEFALKFSYVLLGLALLAMLFKDTWVRISRNANTVPLTWPIRARKDVPAAYVLLGIAFFFISLFPLIDVDMRWLLEQ